MEKEESNYNMIDWWKKVVFKNYANFQGRARRAEYWNFALVNFLLVIPFYAIALTGLLKGMTVLSVLGSTVYMVVAIGTLVPGLAVAVRRLHDLNKSGWYYFIALIPLIGAIILLVWFFTDGNRSANNYGEDPKNPAGPEFDFEQKAVSADGRLKN
ncbi:MAG: hypothetical protein JWR61_2565 [Ferruginibacter sp.]|uniref:DUF805 domain-containing protein n=1 Tax=Ferruginibacter sp. TaxID=1940288 RepID=UPI00265801D3|nr:DUF805 domain-containing protein [Ferruginibacter sp.]MDB5277610.1 hypothetical protein [Ferruginibacter sp.]